MPTDILSLAKRFISIKSDPDRPEELARALELALSQLKGFTVERFEKNGVNSALIYTATKRPKKFKVILNGHLDVIPGKDHQYVPRVKGDRLYGVGSMDMKANVACLIAAFKVVAAKVDYPLGLQLVTDEEVGGFNGTKYQIEKGVRADFVLAGEPTNFNIVHKAKGVLWVQVCAKGKTAHGAYPWRGDNAVWKMKKFLDALAKKFPLPRTEKWVTTVNVSAIETGNCAFNKIPDECTTSLDIRFIPGQSDVVLSSLKNILPKGCTLKVLANEPALFVEKQNRFVQALRKAAHGVTKKQSALYGAQGSSDARHYARVKGAGVEFGPVGEGIGTDDEWVHIPSLERYCRILQDFLISL